MRLVDADALKAIRFHDLPYSQIVSADCDTDEKVSAYKLGWNDAIDTIVESVPTVDHIKHGHWVDVGHGLAGESICKCSICGHQTPDDGNYCPNCGAYMGVVKHETC